MFWWWIVVAAGAGLVAGWLFAALWARRRLRRQLQLVEDRLADTHGRLERSRREALVVEADRDRLASTLDRQLGHAEEVTAGLGDEIDELRSALSRSEQEVDAARIERDRAEQLASQVDSDLVAARRRLEALEAQLEVEGRRSVEIAERGRLDWQLKRGELEDAARQAAAARADAESRLARITAANRTAEADLVDARSVIKETDRLRATVKQLRSELIEERTARWSTDALVSEAERRIAGLQRSAASTDTADLRAEVDRLRREIDATPDVDELLEKVRILEAELEQSRAAATPAVTAEATGAVGARIRRLEMQLAERNRQLAVLSLRGSHGSDLRDRLIARDAEVASLRSSLEAVGRARESEIRKLRGEVEALRIRLLDSSESATMAEDAAEAIEEAERLAAAVGDLQARLLTVTDALAASERQREQLVLMVENRSGTGGRVAPPGGDDLTRINGIGPVLQALLNDLGIFTFAQVAGLTEGDVAAIEEAMVIFPGRIGRDRWISQARMLDAQ